VICGSNLQTDRAKKQMALPKQGHYTRGLLRPAHHQSVAV
jgi:hypothetical protein